MNGSEVPLGVPLVPPVGWYWEAGTTGSPGLFGSIIDPSSPKSGFVTGCPVRAFTNGPCGIPSVAKAFVLNATVIPTGRLGYLSLWPQGQAQPLVSTLNAGDAALTSNEALVPTTNGSIRLYATDLTHVVLDLSGFFAE